MEKLIPEWAEGLDCAVTICDRDAKIIFMNERSRATFARHGDIIGHDLLQYHPPRAQEMIKKMLKEDVSNCYTITKNGQSKLIFQSPWRKDGEVAGLVEVSIVVPSDAPHYTR